MQIKRRAVSFAFASFFASIGQQLQHAEHARAFVLAPMASSRRSFVTSTVSLMAAPGVVISSADDIRAALKEPKSTVVDVRSVEEIVSNGHWATQRPWVHAQCTMEACPLLSVAAESLLPDKEGSVVVYCGSGKRAAKAVEVLKSMGYKSVLNAGGFPGDTSAILIN